MKLFLSPDECLYLYKSTIRSCMEYSYHFWAGAPSCYWELVDKQMCRAVGPSLAASLEPLAQCRNVASLSLFHRYSNGICSSELAPLFPFLVSRRRSTLYSDRLHDFSVTILRCFKDVYVNSFFLLLARLWNCLPVQCFPLTYNLNRFKSRKNKQLYFRLFLKIFLVYFVLYTLFLVYFSTSFSCNFIPCSVC